jgi:hypothetical protein
MNVFKLSEFELEKTINEWSVRNPDRLAAGKYATFRLDFYDEVLDLLFKSIGEFWQDRPLEFQIWRIN